MSQTVYGDDLDVIREVASEQLPLLRPNGSLNGSAVKRNASHPSTPTGGDLRSFKNVLKIAPGLLLAVILSAFDTGYTLANYTVISSKFQHLSDAAWILLTTTVAFSAFQPIYGRLAQTYRHKSLLIVAFGIFGLGTFLCALSANMWELATARGVVGIGASGCVLLMTMIVNDVVPLNALSLCTGAIAFSASIGMSLGSTLGSSVLEKSGWKTIYYIEPAMMALCGLLVYITNIQEPKKREDTAREGITAAGEQFDFLGSSVLIVAVGVPLVALSLAGNRLPWTHPIILALVAITPALVALFIYAETNCTSEPILPLGLFRNRRAMLVIMGISLMVIGLNIVAVNIPWMLQLATYFPSPEKNLGLTTFFIGEPFGIVTGGLYVLKFGRFKKIALSGIGAMTVVISLLVIGAFRVENMAGSTILAFFGAGYGLIEGVQLVSLLSTASKEEHPLFIGLFDLFLAFAGDFGVAISSSARQSISTFLLRQELGESEETERIIAASRQSFEFLNILHPDVHTRVVNCLVTGFRFCLLIGLVSMVCAGLCTLLWTDQDTREDTKSDIKEEDE